MNSKNSRVNVISTMKSFLIATVTVALLSFISLIQVHAAQTIDKTIKVLQ